MSDTRFQKEFRRRIDNFTIKMKLKLDSKYQRKGESYLLMNPESLLLLLLEHVAKEDWIDVANFCFMLEDKSERIRDSYI